MPEVRRPVAFVVLGLLCGQFLLLGLIQASRDSVTVDEAVDLTAGLVAVERHDLRMNPEHGLFHHVVPGVLPALIADPVIPDTAAYDDGDWFDYTDDLIRANDRAGRLDDVVFWFRVVPLLLGAATGLLLYVVGARLANRSGGLVAAGVWLTTPYVLGLAHLGSLDISFTFWVVASVLAFDRWRETPVDARALALAGVLGAALLTRHTAIVLVPVVLVSVVVVHRGRDRWLAQAAMVLLVPLVVVWVGYRAVDPTPVEGAPRDRFEALISTASADSPVAAAALAVPLPVEWRAGLAYLTETSDDRPAYLLGESWSGGRWWFFPASAAVKLPATFFLAIAAGAWAMVRASRGRARRAAVVVAPLAGVLAVFLAAQPLDLGLRLAVPVLAPVVALSAGVVDLSRRTAVAVLMVVGAGQFVAQVAAFPESLAWTPPPFSDGYRAVSDSSIDFGQANETVRGRHETTAFVAASLTAPRGYDVLPGVPRVETAQDAQLMGDVVVSATELTVTHAEELSWLRAYCPVEVIASSVLRYRFETPVDRSPGPDTPASPCRGEVSARP